MNKLNQPDTPISLDTLTEILTCIELEFVLQNHFLFSIGVSVNNRIFFIQNYFKLIKMEVSALAMTGLSQVALSQKLHAYIDQQKIDPARTTSQELVDMRWIVNAILVSLDDSAALAKSDMQSGFHRHASKEKLTSWGFDFQRGAIYQIKGISYIIGATFANETDRWIHDLKDYEDRPDTLGLPSYRLSELWPYSRDDFDHLGRLKAVI